MEGRVLFPAAALPMAPVVDREQLPVALAEEKQWADEANALRRKEIARREAAERKSTTWRVIGVAAPALLIVLLGVLYLTRGRGYRLGGRGETSFDIPDDLPPALVAALWDQDDIARRGVPATLLDLVQRGELALEKVPPEEPGYRAGEVTYRFRHTPHESRSLRSFEHALIGLLFRDAVNDGPVSIGRLREYAKESPEQVGSRLRQFHAQVLDEGGFELTDEPSRRSIKTLRVLSGLVGVLAVVAALVTGDWWCLLGVPVAIAVFVVAPRQVRQLTPEALEKYRAYRRLRNFMRAADGMDWKPPGAVVVWERYLVLAVVFGLADTVLKALQVKAPDVVADPAFPAWLWLGG